MADKLELLHLSQPGSSLLIRSEVHSSLIARGRKDAASLTAHKSEQLCRAIVKVRKGSQFDGAGKIVLPLPPRLWGLIDATGKFVVEPVYHCIEHFSCGLAAFSISPVSRLCFADCREELFNSDEGQWGYFDHAGTVVIAPRFQRVRGFSEDLAGVEIDGQWGFIYKDGTFAIEPRFTGVRDFKDGLAVARLGKRCGFIDRTGAFSIEPQFDYLWEFSEGLACADINGKSGYIERSGAFVIAPQFDSLQSNYFRFRGFRHGVAIAVGADGIDCVINQAGGIVFRCAEDRESLSEFTDSIARVSEAGGYWDNAYYIDTFGRAILKNAGGQENDLAETFDAAGDFSEGLGVVAGSFAPRHGDELWPLWRFADRRNSIRLYGYIDKQGNMRIDPQFRSARPFKNGLAVVDPNGDEKYGFIDTNGAVVIEAGFAEAKDFENGMARIKENTAEGKWGFIDKTGKVVIPCQFDEAFFAEDFQQVAE
jgi:hypothetical protein